jgi:hypothetical protein
MKIADLPQTGKNVLCLCAALLPPSIIMFHLFAQNYMEVSFFHVLAVDAVFTLLNFCFYTVMAKALKQVNYGGGGGITILISPALWLVNLIILRLYSLLINFFIKPLRYAISFVISVLLIYIIVRILRCIKEIKIIYLFAIFEITLFLLNVIPSILIFAQNKDGHKTSVSIKPEDFNIDHSLPSPNIYWIFMDGMAGFKAVETLFGSSQPEFTAALEERGFVINRDAEFEALHGTVSATPSLFCPNWYDTVFAPLLYSSNLQNYAAKSHIQINTSSARINNEFIAAFNAKNYMTSVVNTLFFTGFSGTAQKTYMSSAATTSTKNKTRQGQIIMARNLNYLLTNIIAPWNLIANYAEKFISGQTDVPAVPASASPFSKEDIYGKAYIKNKTNQNDLWVPDALAAIAADASPRLVIIYDSKAHYPFVFNKDGSSNNSAHSMNLPQFYMETHCFAAKMVLAYIDMILHYDSAAIIVVEADHGLHGTETRKAFLAEGKTDDVIRMAQNQTMSAVRIPAQWGGLDAPLDPLNISRELVNRYVGKNYTLLEKHP